MVYIFFEIFITHIHGLFIEYVGCYAVHTSSVSFQNLIRFFSALTAYAVPQFFLMVSCFLYHNLLFNISNNSSALLLVSKPFIFTHLYPMTGSLAYTCTQYTVMGMQPL